MKSIFKIAITTLLGGVLLALSVPPFGWFFLVFVAFIPVYHLFYEHQLRLSKFNSSIAIFVTYLTWLLIEYYWLVEEYPGTYFVGSIANATCFAIPFYFLPIVLKKFKNNWVLPIGFISAISCGEWISQSTELTSPFCNLGLILGQEPNIIQHYRWIGVEGAGIWIVAINILIYSLVRKILVDKTSKLALRPALLLFFFISLPVLAQLKTSDNNADCRKIKVAVLRTDLDHYSDFFLNHPERMIDTLLRLSDDALGQDLDILVWPEVIVNPIGWLHQIDSEKGILKLKERLRLNSQSVVAFGASAFSLAGSDDVYAMEANGYYFNTHNLSLVVGAKGNTRYKSKDKFIAFQERMPFMEIFPSLKEVARNWEVSTQFSPLKKGGTSLNEQNGFSFESALCYESLFSLYMMKKAQADLIVIHASEKWMNNPLGSIQYHHSISPIAIQMGRPIARSTNAGIASIISSNGEVLRQTFGKGKADVLIKNVVAPETATVYASLSGYFYGISAVYSCLILFMSFIKSTKNV